MIVDLTIPITHAMRSYPGEPTAGFTPFTSLADDGVEMWQLSLFTQLGTHMDAPSHFVIGGRSIDAVDLERCVGPAVVVSVSGTAGCTIGIEPFIEHESAIVRTRRVVLQTGWARYVDERQYFEDWPVITREAALWLVERDCHLLALDTPAPHKEHNPELHRILFSNEMVLLESLVNTDRLSPGAEVYLIALPLPFVGLDGSPVRVVAITDNATEGRQP